MKQPIPPVRGWEPWRRGHWRRAWRRWCLWLNRVECRDNSHKPQAILIRRAGSRFHVELLVCRRCHQVIEAEGRRSFGV